MKQRIAEVDNRECGCADDDTAARRQYGNVGVLIGVGDLADDLAGLHDGTDPLRGPQDAAFGRADPGRGIGKQRPGMSVGGTDGFDAVGQFQHSDGQHHARDAVDAGLDRELVEPQTLAAFIDQYVDSYLAGRLAQGAGALGAFQDHFGAKGLAQFARARAAFEIAADLGKIDAVDGCGVEVDADLGPFDDLGQQQVCDARGERAVGAAGKGTIEVAPVREVTRAADEGVGVDDGHAQQRSSECCG